MNPEYQTASNISLLHILEKTEKFTFPPVRKKVQTMELREPFTGVWAVENNEMIGMILADKKDNISEIFSFYVKPDRRNQKIGHELLKILERVLKDKGINQIQTRYRDDWGSIVAIEKLLQAHNWEKPSLLRVIAEIEISKFHEVNWPEIKLLKGYKIIKWSELNNTDIQYIITSLGDHKIPHEFNPFNHEDKVFLPASAGIKFDEKIVGWNIVYQLDEDTIEYNNLYIMENHRNVGLAIPLLYHCFGEQYKNGTPKSVWMINAVNTPVMKIARRIANEFVNKLTEVRVSRKVLQ